ncbi:hypothetical protein H8A97_03725 [Bradyrhizobium sp. Arg62]|uniref:hypothetical protein n=1 Tax=Bradyrhizobium brasilense TaxID=1419277 RepID=UPI001E34F4BE|nr:hypothetical protein [Bradyrhizobium brasilense]MCC8944233.1 hypothetical protein [Bradyrhizobium brasilense]
MNISAGTCHLSEPGRFAIVPRPNKLASAVATKLIKVKLASCCFLGHCRCTHVETLEPARPRPRQACYGRRQAEVEAKVRCDFAIEIHPIEVGAIGTQGTIRQAGERALKLDTAGVATLQPAEQLIMRVSTNDRRVAS